MALEIVFLQTLQIISGDLQIKFESILVNITLSCVTKHNTKPVH
jgi:hypothetical protein